MKKLFIILITVVCVLTTPMYVNAGHKHTDSCYSIQGAHTHSGDSINGGGCYGTPIYHVHEGQAGQTIVNGCYTVPINVTETCGTYVEKENAYKCSMCDFFCGYGNYEYYKNAPHSETCNNTTFHFLGYSLCSGCGARGDFTLRGTAHTKTVEKYDLGCGKTEQTVEYYELSCGLQESAGTKVLTCTTPESVDTPAPTPEPTPSPTPEPAPVEKPEPSYTYKDLNKTMYTQTELNVRNTPSTDGALLGRLAAGEEVKVTGQCNETAWYRIDYNGSAGYVTNLYLGTEKPVEEPAETVPVETIPEETVEEVTISIDASDFDFALDYSFTGDGLYVILKPTNSLALADIPYSWDNKVTWNTNTECLFTEPGEYHISVKNVDGEIKTKILTVDFELQTVTIENEETALANANIEEPKSSGVKIPFKAIFIVILVLAAVGGVGFLVFRLLAGAGITAKVIDDGTDVTLGTVKFKKKGSSFEVIISDKILMNKDTTLALLPDANALKKYRGYSLTVKSSVGVVETAILNKIEVEF